MHKILLSFIVLCLFGKHDCSFLSRLKNRYEYAPQENNIQLFTEDLYDFEFTNIETTRKANSRNIFNGIDTTEEIVIYPISSSILSNKSEPNQKRSDVIRTYERITVPDADGPIFLYRPTLHSSVMTSSKPREALPTYFPRKILPPLSGIPDIPITNAILNNMLRTQDTPSSSRSPPSEKRKPTANYSTLTTVIGLSSLENIKTMTISITNNATKSTYTTTTSETPVTVVSYCYRCGLNETRIPTTYCYNTFEGDDRSFARRQRELKIKCILSNKTSEVKKVAYGPSFRKGCFKRFLDVGNEYNERGCRTAIPTKGKSFASKRFAYTEKLLKYVDDGCAYSPHASVTPFSRAISLFARYHVCVCSQRYCNRANTTKECFMVILCTIFNAYLSINFV